MPCLPETLMSIFQWNCLFKKSLSPSFNQLPHFWSAYKVFTVMIPLLVDSSGNIPLENKHVKFYKQEKRVHIAESWKVQQYTNYFLTVLLSWKKIMWLRSMNLYYIKLFKLIRQNILYLSVRTCKKYCRTNFTINICNGFVDPPPQKKKKTTKVIYVKNLVGNGKSPDRMSRADKINKHEPGTSITFQLNALSVEIQIQLLLF